MWLRFNLSEYNYSTSSTVLVSTFCVIEISLSCLNGCWPSGVNSEFPSSLNHVSKTKYLENAPQHSQWIVCVWSKLLVYYKLLATVEVYLPLSTVAWTLICYVVWCVGSRWRMCQSCVGGIKVILPLDGVLCIEVIARVLQRFFFWELNPVLFPSCFDHVLWRLISGHTDLW